MDAHPDFDPAPLLSLRDATDAATAREIIEIFAGDAPAALAGLRTALAAGQADLVRKAAHRLKGAAGTVGLLLAQECCVRIEGAARDGALAGVPMILATLENSVERGLAQARNAPL